MAATISAAVNFSTRPALPPIRLDGRTRVDAWRRRACFTGLPYMKMKHCIAINRTLVMKSTADDNNDNISFVLRPLPASTMISKFYKCINEKNIKELSTYVAEDICLEDCSFTYPLQGKKEVMNFYKQLTTGMGQNMRFVVEHVCEDDDLTAGVNWHLAWNNTQIPFTRGCSFYECSLEGDQLVIKNALAVIESPIKPGLIVLSLLKNVTGIFDDYPKAAEWFLKSPHVVLQFVLNIYHRFFAPIINPVLAGYMRMWDFTFRSLVFAFQTVLYIIKKFFS